jgi:mannan endo-1,4-beta-mannosidase
MLEVRRFLVLLVTALASVAAQTSTGSFVKAVNDQLMLNGSPFRFGGANSYVLMFSPQATVDQVLQTAAANHFNGLRMWSFDDIGVPTSSDTFYLQYWNGSAPAYNDNATTGLGNVDYAVYRAGQLGIKLIIPFVNNWPNYGGMDQYVTWLGGQYHDQFYTDPTIRQWYKNWISHLLNHVNSMNGLAFKDDPTIMIWELANEPRCQGQNLPTSGSCTSSTITSWIQDVAAYVKTVDTNHLVSVGDEGFFCVPTSTDYLDDCATGVDTIAFAQTANVDLAGFHLYPEAWGETVAWADGFIDQHFSDAMNTVGKPAYMGEYGLMAGNTRNVVYQDWTNRVFNDGGSGALFWDIMPGSPSPYFAESSNGFDVEATAPILLTVGDFAQMMEANSAMALPPVAGDQWATTPFNSNVNLNPLGNDVAYAGAAINPNTIDLAPNTAGLQTSVTVYGGTFSVVGHSIQFTPAPNFEGQTQASYTVTDSTNEVSNPAYLFVTVNPSPTGIFTLESFEFGAGGWGPTGSAAGTVSQTSMFSTDGGHGLQVNVTAAGWFGVMFPSPFNLSGRTALAIDIETTAAGASSAIAFQSGSNYVWCQNSTFASLPANGVGTISIALNDPSQITCYGGSPDLTDVLSAMVYLNPGTYYLDNLRAIPSVSSSSPSVTGALNGASFGVGAPVPEGGIASLFGANLASNTTAASSTPLPDNLDGISVTVNDIPAALYFVSSGQINVQIPWNALPSGTATGTGAVVVSSTATGLSQSFSIPIAAAAPALFTTQSGVGQAIAINADGTLADTNHPATPGSVLVLLANGLGPVGPSIADGAASSDTLRSTLNVPTVLIGGIPAQVVFSGLSPQFVGVNQINVVVPTGVTPGNGVSLQIQIGSLTTSSNVTIAVAAP